jgi:hypothetical protein
VPSVNTPADAVADGRLKTADRIPLAAEDRITARKNVLSGFLTSIRFMASRLTQGDQFPYDQQADKKVGIIVTVTIDTEASDTSPCCRPGLKPNLYLD